MSLQAVLPQGVATTFQLIWRALLPITTAGNLLLRMGGRFIHTLHGHQ